MNSFNSLKLSFFLIFSALPAIAAPEFLNLLSGCFQVTYHYVEEGKVVYPSYYETGYEWIKLESEEKSIELRHYGIFNQGGEAVAMKHWGQSWTQVNDTTWTLAVLSPSDTPRYQCTAEVKKSTLDGVTAYQRNCDALKAPKPRRDKDRKDYETLDRQHTWNITPTGWQDVQKNVKRDKEGAAVAHEIGWNEYKRVDPEHCKAAMNQ